VIDRVFDAASGTLGVRLELPNRQQKLPAGVRCKARFPGLDSGIGVQTGGSSKQR
jgi:hypothetical protein